MGYVTTLTALTKPLSPIFPVLLDIHVFSSLRSFPRFHSYLPPHPFTNRPTHLSFVVVTIGPLTYLPHFETFFSLSAHLYRSPEPVGTSTLERSSSATQTQPKQIDNEQLSTAVRNENPFQSFGGLLGDGSLDPGGERELLPVLGGGS